MDVPLASITLVKQLHFRMLTFGNCTIPFLASSSYQTAHIVPVVGISAGSSKTSGRISSHHHGIPILVDMRKSCSLLCSILVPMHFFNVSVYFLADTKLIDHTVQKACDIVILCFCLFVPGGFSCSRCRPYCWRLCCVVSWVFVRIRVFVRIPLSSRWLLASTPVVGRVPFSFQLTRTACLVEATCYIRFTASKIRAFSIGLPTVKCGGRTAKSSEFGSRPARQRPK
jgi:hypothetical protein